MDDFKIIVAEEVMTGDAGEVIGLPQARRSRREPRCRTRSGENARAASSMCRIPSTASTRSPITKTCSTSSRTST